MKRVIRGVRLVPMGLANAFLIESDDGLTLIDAGYLHKEAAVFEAIRRLNRSQDQLKHVIFTHGHPDHIGSGAAIVRGTGARTYMHPLDIPIAESGGPFRPMTPAPGLLGRVLCNLFFSQVEKLDSVISILEELIGRNTTAPMRRGSGRGRVVSAAARRRMAAAQRARWARERAQVQPTVGANVRTTPKRRKLAAAPKSISTAVKARWARFRARKAH